MKSFLIIYIIIVSITLYKQARNIANFIKEKNYSGASATAVFTLVGIGVISLMLWLLEKVLR
jgi:hypothetical protein